MIKRYYRIAYRISLIHVLFLIIFVVLAYYAAYYPEIWEGEGYVHQQRTFIERLSSITGYPLRISIIIFSLDMLPELGLYSLIVSVFLIRDFYLKAKGKNGQFIIIHCLFYSPLILWLLSFFISWSLLIWELQDIESITYLNNGEVQSFSLYSIPPLWNVILLFFIMFLPLLLRMAVPIMNLIYNGKDSDELITLRKYMKLSIIKKVAYFFILFAVIVSGYMFYIRPRQKPEQPLNLPVHRISNRLQRLDLNRSEHRYLAARRQDALQYAEEHEFPVFPYLISVMLKRDYNVEHGAVFILEFVDKKTGLKAVEVKHDSTETVVIYPPRMQINFREASEPGAAPLIIATLEPSKFKKDITSLNYKRVDDEDYYILEIPAGFNVDKWRVRLINEKGDKSNWVPLFIWKDVKKAAGLVDD